MSGHRLTVTEMYLPSLDVRSEMHSRWTDPTTSSTLLIIKLLNTSPPLPIAVKLLWMGYLFTLEGMGEDRQSKKRG
jgi:hypothetical protein